MDEDRPEDTPLSPDSGRAKRAPPTIDLEASEVSGGKGTSEDTRAGASAAPQPKPSSPSSSAAISAMVTSAVTGAVTAALVIAAAWYVGWPGETASQMAAPPANAAAIDALTSRVADIESRSARPASTMPDPAATARVEALEKSMASLRAEIAGARAQSEKLAAEVNAVKSAPREAAAPPDLRAINERLSQIERATRAESAEIAQQSNKPADDCGASPRRGRIDARHFGPAGRAFRRRARGGEERSPPMRMRSSRSMISRRLACRARPFSAANC